MAYKINEDLCIGCGTCAAVCPNSCISHNDECKYKIDAECCVSCGKCASVCPVEAISKES